MSKHTSEPVIRVIPVTPEMARTWLRTNTHNRRISPTIVDRYRRDMLSGRWKFAADPVRFGDDGTLLDGQHRLAALAGCPDGFVLDMLVVTKLSSDTQMVMDQGKKRSAGGQLQIIGVADANIAAAGIKLYLSHQTGLMFRDAKVRDTTIGAPQIQQWFIDHQDEVEQVGKINTRCCDAPPSVVWCAAALFIDAAGLAKTSEFFHFLKDGAGFAGDPINTLDKRLQKIRRDKVRTSSREFLALFILAWNAWNDNRRITKFQMPKGAKWTADTFPQVKAVA